MKITCIKPLAFLFIIGNYPSVAAAQFDSLSIPELLNELETLSVQIREADSEILENISAKEMLGRTYEENERERENYNSRLSRYDADVSSHNSEVNKFKAECGSGSFEEESFNSCESREASLVSEENKLNIRLNELESVQSALDRKIEDYNRRERERTVAVNQLITQYDEYNSNVEQIMALLTSQPIFSESNLNCADRPSPEAAHQCMKSIWDEYAGTE